MKVKLIKGLSYTTQSGSFKKEKVYSVSDEEAKKLLETGRFEEVSGVADDDAGKGPEGNNGADKEPEGDNSNNGSNNNAADKELSAEAIDKLKKDELIALAAEKEIDISECNNNEERAEKIKGALGLVNMAQLFGE